MHVSPRTQSLLRTRISIPGTQFYSIQLIIIREGVREKTAQELVMWSQRVEKFNLPKSSTTSHVFTVHNKNFLIFFFVQQNDDAFRNIYFILGIMMLFKFCILIFAQMIF